MSYGTENCPHCGGIHIGTPKSEGCPFGKTIFSVADLEEGPNQFQAVKPEKPFSAQIDQARMDYFHAAKVVSDFLQADDSAYESEPDIAFEAAQKILHALYEANFNVVHNGQVTIPAQSIKP